MVLRNPPLKLHRALTHDPDLRSPTMKLRKRLLSEHHEESNVKKRPSDGLVEHESCDKQQNHHCSLYASNSACVFLHSPNASAIKGYSTTTTTPPSMTEVETIICPIKSILSEWNRDENLQQPFHFLSSHHLSIYLKTPGESENLKMLIVDCGIPFRFHERHITNALLLNVTDRLSRKRLAARGLKVFLDPSQLDRFDQSEVIVLYDDSIHLSPNPCGKEAVQPYQLSATMQCLLNEIRHYDSRKKIFVLQSTFDDFAQRFPEHCHIAIRQHAEPSEDQLFTPEVDPDSVEMSEILPGLFLGSENDAKNRQRLEQNQIGVVLNISTDIPCYYADDSNIEYRQIHCLDSGVENIVQHFEQTFAYMKRVLDEQKRNVLVHCYAGISRSPSFVIGYLMRCHSKSFREAYQMVQNKRQIINPNLNFLSQLSRYEKHLQSAQVSN